MNRKEFKKQLDARFDAFEEKFNAIFDKFDENFDKFNARLDESLKEQTKTYEQINDSLSIIQRDCQNNEDSY